MATRNRTASWLHYPLPQPAGVPLALGDLQQVLWAYRLTSRGAAVAATAVPEEEIEYMPGLAAPRVTVRSDLDWCQRLLGDAVQLGDDGALWTRAELLALYNDGYRALLTQSQAVRRFTGLDVPGRVTYGITSEWEARYVQGGTHWKFTWSAPGYECTSLWEVQCLEGVTPEDAQEAVTQEWERAFVNPAEVPFRFALPRDHERIVGLWYDHRRLPPVDVRELDALERDWRTLVGYPLAWTPGTGRSGTFEIYEIVTAYSQGYRLAGAPWGIPRTFSGERTYATTGPTLYGLPRRLMSPDRQYLATTGPWGRPTTYHTSPASLLLLEVIGPELPDLHEEDAPLLIPGPLQKYLRYYTLAQAWDGQGEGRQPALAALCMQRFARGVQVLKNLAWLTRKDSHMQRVPAGSQGRRRPPRVQLPSTYGRV